MDVYGDNRGIIADCIPETEDFIEAVLPETDDLTNQDLTDEEINVSEYF